MDKATNYKFSKKRIVLFTSLVLIFAVLIYAYRAELWDKADLTLVQGNGRLEATEIDIATRLGGQIDRIYVNEGDYVTASETVAAMEIDSLVALRDEALAKQEQAIASVDSAIAQVAVKKSERIAANTVVYQREAELQAAMRRLLRSELLSKEGASSGQELDDDIARAISIEAALMAAKAQVSAAESALISARKQVDGSRSVVNSIQATVQRINVDIEDSTIKAPRTGRIQYRIAQPGEVIPNGGKILNLVDLSEVYMTFFLPEKAAGRVGMGSEVRIRFDAAPDLVIPAHISYIASTAQFTPKTVETQSEREKLMFKVKAQIDPALLLKYLSHVKTGIPGVAWVKLEKDTAWPERLNVKLPK